ncbi:MAG: hypothetical protein PHI73_03985 [Patescibacteria group bacterium]|nr:hypothetical protein [Patescibacteria group bacterium]
MKKVLIPALILFFGLTLAWQTDAATWQDKYHFPEPYMAGGCIMVNLRSEADATHVYTLNPDNTYYLNYEYRQRWSRNARCDELQFHVDHNTTRERLVSWLNSVASDWYKNIGSSHFKNQTVSTTKNEWFYIDSAGAHRIPDWLTSLSWGLLIQDKLTIEATMTGLFYKNVTIAPPLQFNDGQYASKITAIWKNGDRDFSTLPVRLADVLEGYTYGYPKIFTSCPSPCGSPTDRNCGSLLDWRWTYSNLNFGTCPASDKIEDWRNGDTEAF